MDLGHLLTRSGLTYPEVSSKVSVNKNSKKGIISTVYHVYHSSISTNNLQASVINKFSIHQVHHKS